MVGLSVIRQAGMDDFEAVFNLVWPHVHEISVGTPSVEAAVHHIYSLLAGDGVIFVNDAVTAAGAAWLSDGAFTHERLATGLWLVSEAPREGLKVAKRLVEWARDQDAIPACSARPELEKFYNRLGMKPREIVFTG